MGQDALAARLKKLPANPGLMLEPGDEGGWEVTPRHSDKALWEMQLAECFGTRSTSLIRVFLDQLAALLPNDYDEAAERWKRNETEWNAALAVIAGVKPRNVQEAMLAAQMVAVHWMQMRMSAQALNEGGMMMEKDAAIAGKLARTFTMQLDALRLLRGGQRTARQSIKVRRESHHHQHIHIHRGAEETDAQPQDARAGPTAQRAALPSPSEGNGEVVPLRRNAGKAGLP